MTVINPGGGTGGAAFTQGTAVAKPATPAANALYFATDTGEWWVGNAAGNAWQSIGSTSVPFTINGSSLVLGRTGGGGAGAAVLFNPGGSQSSFDSSSVNNMKLTSSDLDLTLGGFPLRVKEGTNAKQGTTGAMTAGAVTVANTSVTATSRIFVCRGAGGTNPGAWYVSAQTVGTSFVVTSTNVADTGNGVFQIFEPG